MVPERNAPLLRKFSGNPNTHLAFSGLIQPSRVEVRVRVQQHAKRLGKSVQFVTLNCKYV